MECPHVNPTLFFSLSLTEKRLHCRIVLLNDEKLSHCLVSVSVLKITLTIETGIGRHTESQSVHQIDPDSEDRLFVVFVIDIPT